MPSCSASDAQSVDGLPPTAPGATMNAAAADGVTDAQVPAPRGPGCWRERCRNHEMGGTECPPGICQRDGKGNPSPWHARPPCPDHDKGRPWGLEDAAPAPAREAAAAATKDPAAKRQDALVSRLLPAVYGYVECLKGLEKDGALTEEERRHIEGLRGWLEKLRAEHAAAPRK